MINSSWSCITWNKFNGFSIFIFGFYDYPWTPLNAFWAISSSIFFIYIHSYDAPYYQIILLLLHRQFCYRMLSICLTVIFITSRSPFSFQLTAHTQAPISHLFSLPSTFFHFLSFIRIIFYHNFFSSFYSTSTTEYSIFYCRSGTWTLLLDRWWWGTTIKCVLTSPLNRLTLFPLWPLGPVCGVLLGCIKLCLHGCYKMMHL